MMGDTTACILLSVLSSVFSKQKYAIEIIPLISIILLFFWEVPVALWFAVVVIVISVSMVILSEAIRESVKRMPNRGYRFLRNYQQYLKKWKNSRKGVLVMKSVPLPWCMTKVYLTTIAIYLFVYVWLMVFTAVQGRPETRALFIVQLIALLWVYGFTFVRIKLFLKRGLF
jgi:short subunit dehydrogenase-like uncharacterized protein